MSETTRQQFLSATVNCSLLNHEQAPKRWILGRNTQTPSLLLIFAELQVKHEKFQNSWTSP